ncbi:MAG: cytochrome c-type biogenesis protein CcmH [Acidobacteria bacterium]|nr:cytochrome c-type biogenesis protein CcmH [Acidobacteriota bacterium]
MGFRTLSVLCVLAAGLPAWANPAGGNPRLGRLFETFMAPCCWQENLIRHQSPKADDVRQQIRRMVAAGKTDDEIKAVLVGEYSRRILALPEGAAWQWLWWTPWAALMAGGLVAAWAIRRMMRRPAGQAPAAPPVALPEDWDD